MRYFVILFSLLLLSSFAGDPVSAQNQNSEAGVDIERGKVIFFRCSACHTIAENAEVSPTGPSLYGVFGRTAGTATGYENYSKVLKDANFVWSNEALDNWLKNPNGFLPGNTMAFGGVMRQKDRADVIAYIRHESENK